MIKLPACLQVETASPIQNPPTKIEIDNNQVLIDNFHFFKGNDSIQ